MIMVSCINNGQKTAPSSNPVIENVTLHYSQLNKSLFISSEVTDPQGWETIDSVVFYLYRKDSVNSVEEPLFLTGQLVDVGPPLDIINRDDVFSYLVDSTTLADNDGYYRITVQAFDCDGNSSDIETESERVAPNSPPEIFPLSVSDSFEKGDTLIFKLRITDQQGSQDIASATYSVLRPDGEFISDPSFYLSDTGPAGDYGDQYANDGVYTVYQPSNPNSKLQGLYIFYFVAKDIHGATSDTLKANITNPGITLLSPNYSDTLYTTHTYRIEWKSAYISNVKLEYTTNNNATTPSYQNIATVTASTGYYDWSVPNASSSHCKVRISDPDPDHSNRVDVSDNEFQITYL